MANILKRVARANVIIDEDDFLILRNLSNADMRTLDSIRKVTGLSDNGLSTHFKRLISHNLLKIYRDEKNHRYKLLTLTLAGETVKQQLLKSPKLINNPIKAKV